MVPHSKYSFYFLYAFLSFPGDHKIKNITEDKGHVSYTPIIDFPE